MRSLNGTIGMSTAVNDIVFWDVDTQRDFIEPDGKLYVRGSEAIRMNLSALTRFGGEKGRLMGSLDAHTPRDTEFEDWPEHCVYGTPGQLKIPESTANRVLYIPSRKMTMNQLKEVLEFDGQVLFEKQMNDVRTNPNVKPFLKMVQPNLIWIYGLVTEVCVDQAVKYLAHDLGYESFVVADSIKEIDADKARKCMAGWISMGVKTVETRSILEGASAQISTG